MPHHAGALSGAPFLILAMTSRTAADAHDWVRHLANIEFVEKPLSPASWWHAWRLISVLYPPPRRPAMSADALHDLDYTRYARWLRRITQYGHD